MRSVRYRNTGAPMKATTTPAGSSSGYSRTLLRESDATSSAAPKAMDGTARYLLSAPSTILMTWGDTIPMNPMIPVNDTTPAVMSDTTTRQASLYLPTSTPTLVAYSSPEFMAFSLRDVSCTKANPAAVRHSIRGTSDQDMFSREPTCQRNAACMSSEFDVRRIRVVNDPKNIETAVPASRMVAGSPLMRLDTSTITDTGIREKTKAFRTTAYWSSAMDAPSTIASTAPRQAPEETPVE